MTDPASASPPPAGPRHPLARAALRIPALILVTIYFLIDDVVLAAIRPIVARLAELRLFARLAEAIHRLPPYPTLVLFLVPFVVLEPFKLWGLWLVATGHLTFGGTMLAVSHLTSIVLVERLFHATRDKLLTIGWFARAYGAVMRLYDWSVGRLKATAAWRTVATLLHTARTRLRETIARLKASALAARVRSGVAALRLWFLHLRIRLRRQPPA